jgi:DNA (cytosine-5)-methyltransferase 1
MKKVSIISRPHGFFEGQESYDTAPTLKASAYVENNLLKMEEAANELKEIAQSTRSCKVDVSILPDGRLRPFNAGTKAKDGISEYMVDNENGVGSTNSVYGDSTQYRIRKLTPRECFRLMDVSDEDIDKIQASGVSKSQQYKLAGNSIVVSCLYQVFKKMFVDTEATQPRQLTLF